jgi:hypothetical protein
VIVYLFDFVFLSASPSVSLLFDFLVTELTVDEITFICVPRPLGSPSQYREMKLAIASCFALSPLSQVLLFREELRPGVTWPPDPVSDSRIVIAIQPPPPLTFSLDYLSVLDTFEHALTGLCSNFGKYCSPVEFGSVVISKGTFGYHRCTPCLEDADLPHPDSGRSSIRMERREPCDVRLQIKETDSAVRSPIFGPSGRHIPNPNIISLMLLLILGWRDPISILIP